MANKQEANAAWKGVQFLWGWVWAAVKFAGGVALGVTVALMALKGLGVPIAWRTPPMDQNTGVALAAMAYVLSRV